MKKYYFLASALVLSLIAGPVVAAGVSVGTSANVGTAINASVSTGASAGTGVNAGASSGVSAGSSSPAPTLKIINPNGHEFFAMGKPIRIKWEASSNFGNIKIEWREPIVNGLSGTIAIVPVSQGFYDWVPTVATVTYPGNTFSIWISSVDKPQVINAHSLYPFSILASPSDIPTINLKSPKSGEVWRRGETKFISWDTKNVPAEAKINIRLIDDNNGLKKVSEIVTSTPNTGSVTWKVEKRKNLDTKVDEVVPYGKYKVRACIAGALGGCDKTGGDVNIEIIPARTGLGGLMGAVTEAFRSLFGF